MRDLQDYIQKIEENKTYAMRIPRSPLHLTDNTETEFSIFDEDLQLGNLDPWILMGIYNRMSDDTKLDRIRVEKMISSDIDAQEYVSYFFRFGLIPEFFTTIPSNFHYNITNYIPDNHQDIEFTTTKFLELLPELYKYCGLSAGIKLKNIQPLFIKCAEEYLRKQNIPFTKKQLARIRKWEAFDFLNWYLKPGQVKNITQYIELLISAGNETEFIPLLQFEFILSIETENANRISIIKDAINIAMIASGDTDIWNYLCNNKDAISIRDWRLLASNSGVTQVGSKDPVEICKEIQEINNIRMTKHVKNRQQGCNNETGISLEPTAEIPEELLFTFVQNGQTYCEDITMLMELVKSENPQNPYTREPFSRELVMEIEDFAANMVSVKPQVGETISTLLVKLGLAVNPYFPSGDFQEAPEARVLEFVRWMRNTGTLVPFDTENIPLEQKKKNLLESLILETMIFGNGMVKWKIFYGFGLFFNAVYFELMKLYTLLITPVSGQTEVVFSSVKMDTFIRKFMDEVMQGRADTYRMISINTGVEMVLPSVVSGDLSFDGVTQNIIKLISTLENPTSPADITAEIRRICGIIWM